MPYPLRSITTTKTDIHTLVIHRVATLLQMYLCIIKLHSIWLIFTIKKLEKRLPYKFRPFLVFKKRSYFIINPLLFITSFTVHGNYFFGVILQGGREVVLPHNLIRCPKNFWCFHSILVGWFQRLARVQTFQQQKFKSTERDICLTSLGSKSATSTKII